MSIIILAIVVIAILVSILCGIWVAISLVAVLFTNQREAVSQNQQKIL